MSALSLSVAKAHLNITGTPTNLGDTELQAIIDSAEALIGADTGPLEPQTVTRRLFTAGRILVLPVTPVISLTSVVGVTNTAPVNVADLHLDPLSGVVTRNPLSATWFICGTYDVTFEVGYETVPAGLLWAVKEQVKHMVASQRGAGARPGSGDQGGNAPGYLVPYAVADAMRPYMQGPAVG